MPLLIPEAKRAPEISLEGKMIWIYGEPKIGKTTLASQFEGVWFISTEPGQSFLEVYPPVEISSWRQFIEFASQLIKERPTTFGDGCPIRYLALDTVSDLHKLCHAHICKELGLDDPGELPHGKGWNRIDEAFSRVMNALRQLPYGMLCISHDRHRVVKVGGVEHDRTEPDAGAACFRWCRRAADLVLYLYATDVPEKDAQGGITGRVLSRRVAACHPTASIMAGGRMADRLPPIIPLGKAYLDNALSQSLNNPLPSKE